jgi:excisionase family DNA binding protein
MNQERLLTRKDVMEYLRISHGTLDKLIKTRAIPYIKLERKVLFRKSAVEAWLETKLVK